MAIDDSFAASLKARDRKKKVKGEKQKTRGGEITRRKGFLQNFAESHKEQMDDAKTDKMYGSGVALKAAKKNAKDKRTPVVRNPKGTLKHLQRCAYYLHYCQVLGHTTTTNRLCGVNSLAPVERKAIMAKIIELSIEEEVVLVEENRKYILSYFVRSWLLLNVL